MARVIIERGRALLLNYGGYNVTMWGVKFPIEVEFDRFYPRAPIPFFVVMGSDIARSLLADGYSRKFVDELFDVNQSFFFNLGTEAILAWWTPGSLKIKGAAMK